MDEEFCETASASLVGSGAACVALALTLLISAADGAQAQLVTDQRGRQIDVAHPAERSVFLPMPAPSMYMALDGTERHVVGMNPASATAMRDGILGRLFPHVLAISTDITRGAGFTPNVETILSLRPDVVFQWATIGPEPLEVLDRAGLNVAGIRYGGQSDMAGYLGLMGAIAGKSDRAAELISRQEHRRGDLLARVGEPSNAERPKVLYLGRYSDDLRASGRGTYNDFYIRLCGGRNVAADLPAGAGAVSVEQILAWDPDVILLGNFDTAMPADLYADPRLRDVAAVRQRRVYRMPLGGYRWDPPNQESALTWTWLADLLHPAPAGTGLRGDMRDWYRFLYGFDLADDDIDRILFLKENGASAGYQAFGTR